MIFLVLVDTTPARGGTVRDGSIPGVDWKYSYEEAAVYSNWDGFFDNESSIARYEVQSSISGKQLPVQSVDSSSRTHADVSAHLQHGDRILSIISAVNGAGVKTTLTTDGYVIDTTPPELLVIRYADALAGLPFYQSTSDSVKAVWSYRDPESGMKSYRVAVHEIKFGSSFTVYPLVGDWIDFAKQGKDGDLNTYLQRGLSLANGARYVVKVMAINNAELSVIHSTETVTIDTSPPVMRYVSAEGLTYCFSTVLFPDSRLLSVLLIRKRTKTLTAVDASFTPANRRCQLRGSVAILTAESRPISSPLERSRERRTSATAGAIWDHIRMVL